MITALTSNDSFEGNQTFLFGDFQRDTRITAESPAALPLGFIGDGTTIPPLHNLRICQRAMIRVLHRFQGVACVPYLPATFLTNFMSQAFGLLSQTVAGGWFPAVAAVLRQPVF